MEKIIRITTVSSSLKGLLKGQLGFMSTHYEMLGVASDEADHLKAYSKREGVRTIHVPMTRKITPLKDLVGVYRLYKLIKKEKPFIVHTHTPKAGTLGMFAAKLAGVEHRLHTIAGLPLVEITGMKRRLLNLVEKFTYSCATLILPNSFGMRDIILTEGFCKSDKLKVLGNGSSNGIDTSIFDPQNVSSDTVATLKADLNIKKNDTVFLFIGRIVNDKGIKELVEAFSKLCAKQQNVKLLLVGSKEDHLDPLDENTEANISTNPNIICTGEASDVKPYYALCDIFVFPSYREGFPNVVLEAGSMGKPAIVSNINGSNEIVIQDYNGLIVPKKNSEQLYKSMLYLLDNTKICRHMASNARINIVEKYQRQDIWKEILNLYKSLER